MGKEAIFGIFLFILLSLALFWFYGRIKQRREYALLSILERVLDKRLFGRELEEELKGIVRERDKILEDRFDALVKQCIILDVKERMDAKTLFQIISAKMAERVGMKEEGLFRKLWERESESSTAISSTVAVPHLVVEGKRIFDMLVCRARKGVFFSPSAENVCAIFALFGSYDERNFHLRSLSAIAQIAQDVEFEKRWMNAKDEEALRDILLLAKRRRR
jgi:mannitol/fructose-specific phosphotransferase system IIA component (Ntr-type)